MGKVRALLENNGILWQIGELGRVDLGGGGTIAKYVANMNVDVIDLGVPVLSLGMPTVIDAGFFGEDALSGMFVTPRDIDSQVRAGGRLIGYALNLALHRNLTIADVDALIG